MAVTRHKKNIIEKPSKTLLRLKYSYTASSSEDTKVKLIVQIKLIKEKIRTEKNHRISGFNSIRHYEIPADSPA